MVPNLNIKLTLDELYMQENIASDFRDIDVVYSSGSLRSSRITSLFFVYVFRLRLCF